MLGDNRCRFIRMVLGAMVLLGAAGVLSQDRASFASGMHGNHLQEVDLGSGAFNNLKIALFGPSSGTGDQGSKKTLAALVAALRDPDSRIREKSAEALGKFGPDARPAAGALVALFADPDPYVQGKAAGALGKIGKACVPVLTRALKDTSGNVRRCAAIALAKIGKQAEEAVPALEEALHDGNDDVRWCAAIVLGEIGQGAQEAVPALVQCLHDRDQDVRWAAGLALESIDPETRQTRPDRSSAIGLIDSLVPCLMKELHVPGVFVALVLDRSLAWSRGFGIADVRQGNPVTRETLFEAASMTKPIFAYTVMKMAEQGLLDLDRPLAEYLDEPAVPNQPDRKLVTARMVLSHTAGFPNWRKGEEERDGPLPVLFLPGSQFGYSGEGMYALQRVVEHLTAEPIEAYARRTLFDPLAMKSMSYVWTEALDSRLAAGHDTDGAFLQKTKYTHANAAYTLYTTAEEYALFLIEIMRTDRSAACSLSKPSIEAMLSHHVKVDVREPIERPGKAKGMEVWWGLGWSVNTTGEGDIVHHSGANRSGFRCFAQFSPSRGSGIVIMTNGLGGGDLWIRLICAMGDL